MTRAERMRPSTSIAKPRTKPFEAQTLVAKLAVEALGDAILPRLAGFDQCRADALRDDPRQQCLRHELDNVCRRTGLCHVPCAVARFMASLRKRRPLKIQRNRQQMLARNWHDDAISSELGSFCQKSHLIAGLIDLS
jgi:hypothetical protein